MAATAASTTPHTTSSPLRGWRHAGTVRWLQRQPRERRENLLAGAFAVLAAVWAPIGVVMFMNRSTTLFLALTAIAAVLVLAPRPTGSQAFASLQQRTATVVATVRREAGPALVAARREVVRFAHGVRSRVEPVLRDGVARARAAWDARATAQSSPSSAR